MNDLKDNSSIIISGHIMIRDTETGEILLNKSECSLVDNNAIHHERDKYNKDIDKHGKK